MVECIEVGVTVFYPDDLPAVALVALGHIFGEREVGWAIERDVVGVVEVDELAELEMAGERRCLGTDTFHEVAIAAEHPGVVVDEGLLGGVEAMSHVALSDGHADCVGAALAEWPGGTFDARGQK